MGKTISEKILSIHSGKDVHANEVVVCKIDFCFSQDGTSGILIDSFNKLEANKIFDNKKFCMVIDHSAPSPNMGTSQIHKKMRDFIKKYKVKLFEIGCGVCHHIIPEYGYVKPGMLVIGADSHTCTYGALNAFSTGMGSTDVAIGVASGTNWFKVPETTKIIVNGKLKKGTFSKDLILFIIGKLTADGCTYHSTEFYGETIRNLSMDARFTISNMAVEMGAKTGIIEADKITWNWFKSHKIKVNKKSAVYADKDATYINTIEFNASKIKPMVAKPHTVDNVDLAENLEDIKIDQAFLGTCTNGRLEDLIIAAKILKTHSINSRVKFIVAPASKMIYLKAIKLGIIELFIKRGIAIVAPGCGPCVGTHNGIPADGENVISTANRNFKGRMGNSNANIYLASPATVVASAIKGKITTPQRFL